MWYLNLFTDVLEGSVEWSWLSKWLDYTEKTLDKTHSSKYKLYLMLALCNIVLSIWNESFEYLHTCGALELTNTTSPGSILHYAEIRVLFEVE